MDRGALELQEDVVAERDRVGEVLEADAVLGETRNRQDVRVVAPSATTRRSYADLDRPGERLDGHGLRARWSCAVMRPRTSSACGHISRSGTTT